MKKYQIFQLANDVQEYRGSAGMWVVTANNYEDEITDAMSLRDATLLRDCLNVLTEANEALLDHFCLLPEEVEDGEGGCEVHSKIIELITRN